MGIKSFKSNLTLCVLVVTNIITGEIHPGKNLPRIGIDNSTNNWLQISNITTIPNPVYYVPSAVFFLHFYCEAFFPITLNITGVVNPPEFLNIEYVFRNISNGTFTLWIIISSSFRTVGTWPYGSFQVKCEKFDDPKISDAMFLFIGEDSDSQLIPPSNSVVSDSTLIPCPTTNPVPSAAPKLYRRNSNGIDGEVEDTAIRYQPAEGFISTEVFNGLYICKQGIYNTTITAKVSGEYTFIPISSAVLAFSDEVVHLECVSRSHGPLQIVVDSAAVEAGNITVSHEYKDNRAAVQISSKFPNASDITGRAKCITNSSILFPKTDIIVKEWNFEFVLPPALYLDNIDYKNIIGCLSDFTPLMIQVVSCRHKVDCDFRSRCFDSVDSCNAERQVHTNGATMQCIINDDPDPIRNCTGVYHNFDHGLVHCTLRGLEKDCCFTDYNSNATILVTDRDWTNVPQTELVQIQKELTNLNETAQFTCVASSFLFVTMLSFAIEYKDGTRSLLLNDGKTVNISTPEKHKKKKEGLNHVALLEIRVPPDMVAIHCLAPWINTTDIMNASWRAPTTDKQSSETNVLVFIVPLVVVLAILVVVFFVMLRFIKNYKKSQNLLKGYEDNEIDEFLYGRPELVSSSSENQMDTVDFVPYNTDFEIPLDDLEFGTKDGSYLGRGHFSYVVRGKVLSKNLSVAIKVSLVSEDVTLFKSLLSEVKIMIYVGKHDNVVGLIGVCTEGIRNRTIYIVTEICELGSLDKFLRKARPDFISLMNGNQELDRSLFPIARSAQKTCEVITTLDLIGFAKQIAQGMEYVSSKHIVHADLAARNVLLTQNKIVKISDFGLSKKLYQYHNYIKKSSTPVPWRWMSIEALNTLTFSTASDVWAYGITLFEIFTMGDTPFPMEEWNEEFYAKLEGGMRLKRPKYSTPKM